VASSERYLRAIGSRNRYAKRYAEELARAVLDLAVVALARGVVEGGPLKYSSASRLAEAILLATDEHDDQKKAAGGRG
jgi:hypothetical protein